MPSFFVAEHWHHLLVLLETVCSPIVKCLYGCCHMPIERFLNLYLKVEKRKAKMTFPQV